MVTMRVINLGSRMDIKSSTKSTKKNYKIEISLNI